MRHVCRLHPVALSALCALRHDNTQICNCNWLCGWCCCCCQCCFFVSLLIFRAHTLLQIFKYMLQWENKNREKNNANALNAQLQRRKKKEKKRNNISYCTPPPVAIANGKGNARRISRYEFTSVEAPVCTQFPLLNNIL